MREAIVTANEVSVRDGRGQSFAQLGTYKKNDRIIVLDNTLSENYTKVLWTAGYAYCEYGKYIKFSNTGIPAEDLSDETPNAVVTANRISVRAGRAQMFAKLGKFVKDNKIVVLDNDLNQEYSKDRRDRKPYEKPVERLRAAEDILKLVKKRSRIRDLLLCCMIRSSNTSLCRIEQRLRRLRVYGVAQHV